MSRERFFQDWGAERFKGDTVAARQAVFETRCVKRLLRHAGVAPPPRSRELSLEWFESQYSAFPVLLGTAKLPNVFDIRWGELFGSLFLKLPFVRAFQALVTARDIDLRLERVGLVFASPHANRAGLTVLHNYLAQAQNDVEAQVGHTRIVRPCGRPPITYVIESFESFLLTTGTDWST